MHKYMHHIGDFLSDTVHLSPLEECFYRRALDFCYLNESPLPKITQQVYRRLRAITQEETQAVDVVLQEFFTEENDGFHNRRCDEEIRAYQENAHKSRTNGAKGGRPPKNKPKQNPDVNQEETSRVNLGFENETQNNLNHQPSTVNHQPSTVNQVEAAKRTFSYEFDLDVINTKIAMSGKPQFQITEQEKFVFQCEFEDYYQDEPIWANGKALHRFTSWIIRGKEKQAEKPKQPYQTAASKTEAEMDKWKKHEQKRLQGNNVIDVSPEQPFFLEVK